MSYDRLLHLRTLGGRRDALRILSDRQLAADIQPIIEPSGEHATSAEHTDSLKERLAQSIAPVEGAHPKLARTLSDLVDRIVFYKL